MPFAQHGSGIITFVSIDQAYVRPDEAAYGREIRGYAKGQNAQLNGKFQLGNRVHFRYVLNPKGKWIAQDMVKAKKLPGEIIQIPTGIMPGMKGEIVSSDHGYAFIDLDKPHCGRAHMDPKSVSDSISNLNYINEDGKYSLVKIFPVGTSVVFDLHPAEHGHVGFKAKNVRLEDE